MKTYYIRDNKLHFKTKETKLLILKNDKKTIIELNEIGMMIWSLLKSKETIESISSKIAKEYEAPIAEVKKDVEDFIHQCLDISIIKESK